MEYALETESIYIIIIFLEYGVIFPSKSFLSLLKVSLYNKFIFNFPIPFLEKSILISGFLSPKESSNVALFISIKLSKIICLNK